MTELVVIERVARTADVLGGYTEAWTAIGTAWCDVTGVRHGEGERADALRIVHAYIFKMYTDKVREVGLVETDRIVWRNKPYNIREVREVPSRMPMTDVLAETGVTQ